MRKKILKEEGNADCRESAGKWQRLKLIRIQNGGEKPALSDAIQKEEARLWDSQNVIWLTQRLNELTRFQIKNIENLHMLVNMVLGFELQKESE